MSKALEINIGANTREFIKGTGDMQKALGTVSDSLHEVSSDGDKFERAIADNMHEVSKASGRTALDVLEVEEKGMRKVRKGVSLFKEEAIQNFGEVTSSFDGSITGITDGIQGVFGGASIALAGINAPAAIASGALGAVGGALLTGLQNAQKEVEKTTQAITDAYQKAAEDGRTYLNGVEVDAAVTDRIFHNKAEDQKAAASIGVDYMTYVRALSGSASDLQVSLHAAADETERLAKSAQGGSAANLVAKDAVNDTYNVLLQTQKAQEDGVDSAQKVAQYRASESQSLQDSANTLLGIPKSVPVKIAVDDSAVTNLLQPKTLRLNVDVYTRDGRRFL